MNLFKSTCLRKLTAFTLAEILITVGVIGVVAAITIPALINQISDMQYYSAFKSFYRDFTVAFEQIKGENNGTFADVVVGGLGPHTGSVEDTFCSKMQCSKMCPYDLSDKVTSQECWVPDNKYYYRDGRTPIVGADYLDNTNCSGFVLTNGMMVKIRFPSTTCTWGSPPYCGYMSVDVNGLKGPNTYGRDIHFLWITRDKIDPRMDANDCAKNGTGLYTAGCVLNGSW